MLNIKNTWPEGRCFFILKSFCWIGANGKATKKLFVPGLLYHLHPDVPDVDIGG